MRSGVVFCPQRDDAVVAVRTRALIALCPGVDGLVSSFLMHSTAVRCVCQVGVIILLSIGLYFCVRYVWLFRHNAMGFSQSVLVTVI